MKVKSKSFKLGLACTLAIATSVTLNSTRLGITVAILVTTASCLLHKKLDALSVCCLYFPFKATID